MPVAEKSHAHSASLQVLGASVEHRSDEVRLFVRTDAGNALLGFSRSLATQIGAELFAPPASPAPASKTGLGRKYRCAHRAEYLRVEAQLRADPSLNGSALCLAAGLNPKAFYAWKSYQKRIAKNPIAGAAEPKAPVLKPSGALL
jgi:hypothetical protein